MVPKRCKITHLGREFSVSDLNFWFNLKEKSIHHNVDTLYYNVYLKDDTENIPPGSLVNLFNLLDSTKEKMLNDKISNVWFDEENGILFTTRSFRNYKYCISKPGYFDIFFLPRLINSSTPRIHVQLRSIGLWQLGTYESLEDSFRFIKDLLSSYDVQVDKTVENRIDYCYHTNYFQNLQTLYSDDNVVNHLYTSFRLGQKIFNLNYRSLKTETFNLGNKKSNNLFFRSYNKVREVIEENYKGFFLDYWLSLGLINQYDYYVYSKCYSKGSYSYKYSAMMEFYIEYGNDDSIKELFRNSLVDTNQTSDSLKKLVRGILPEPTLIINVEYQTMRKFYYYSDELIDRLPILHNCTSELLRLYQVLDNRKIFLDYLNREVVCFVKDKNVKKKDFVCIPFWKSLQSVKLFSACDVNFKRDYSSKKDLDSLVNRILSSTATLNIYLNKVDTNFADDLDTLINILNDNDLIPESISNNRYDIIKEKKKMALKSILSRPSGND